MNKRHRKRISIIWKVTLWYTAFLCIMALMIVLITYLVSEQILRNSSKEMLINQVQNVYQEIEYDEGQLEVDEDVDFIEKGIYISVFDGDGKLIYGYLPKGVATTLPFVNQELPNYGQVSIRGMMPTTTNVGHTPVNILVLLVLAPLIIVIAIVGGYILTKRAFKPVKQMSKTVDQMFEREKQFTADVSHELRTPVSVILSQCEYAMDDSSKIQLEWVNLSDLLEVIVEDVRERAQKKNINVHAMIEEGIAIKGDETLLMRFFMNLIMNAINYGKESGNIEIALFRENRGTDQERLAGYVSDDGVGIAEENKEKIWRRFYQVDPSRTVKEEGSLGLGLPMVKWIASVHQAEVWGESELGVGSTFFFRFPAK